MMKKNIALMILVLILASAPFVQVQADGGNYGSRVRAFLADPEWSNGTWWGEIKPKTAPNEVPSGCAAYAFDFAVNVWGVYGYKSGYYFENEYEIRDGDVVQIGTWNAAINGYNTHFYVVLAVRNDGTLWTAEGNTYVDQQPVVYVTDNKYSTSNLHPYYNQFICGWHNPNYEPYNEYDDTLSIRMSNRGYEVDIRWSRLRNVSSYHFHIENEGSSYSDDQYYSDGQFAHYGLSEGKWTATVTVTYTNGQTETVSQTIVLPPFAITANVRGRFVDVSWPNLNVDSYWALIVYQSNGQEIYSQSIGNITSTTFELGDADYVIYISAVKNSEVLRSASVTVHPNHSMHLTAETSGHFVDLSWNDMNVDYYWALIVFSGTDQEVYSANIGNITSTTFELSEMAFDIYISAIKDGQVLKSEWVTVSLQIPAASTAKNVYLAMERVTLNCNVETFDTCVLKIYKSGALYWEGAVDSLAYQTSFSQPGDYYCVYAITKSGRSYETAAASWRIVPNDYGTLTLPEGTTTIESQAFSGLTQGVTIILTDKVAQIAEDAFEGSKVLLSVPEGSYAEEYCVKNAVPYRYE